VVKDTEMRNGSELKEIRMQKREEKSFDLKIGSS
jgi:hypothetical protein